MDPLDVSCRTKKRHPSRKSAKEAVKWHKRQGDVTVVEYWCDPERGGCDGWHVGHTPGNATHKRKGRLWG